MTENMRINTDLPPATWGPLTTILLLKQCVEAAWPEVDEA